MLLACVMYTRVHVYVWLCIVVHSWLSPVHGFSHNGHNRYGGGHLLRLNTNTNTNMKTKMKMRLNGVGSSAGSIDERDVLCNQETLRIRLRCKPGTANSIKYHRSVAVHGIPSFVQRVKHLGSNSSNQSKGFDGGEDEDAEEEERNRVVTSDFESLFQGMPSLGDILKAPTPDTDYPSLSPDTDGSVDEDTAAAASDTDTEPRLPPLSPEDLQLIEADLASARSNITQNLKQIDTDDSQNDDLRLWNDDTDNDKATEAILNQVIEEQRQIDIEEITRQKAMDSFDEYQSNKLLNYTTNDGGMTNATGEPIATATDQNNTVVDEIIQKAKDEDMRQRASIDDYASFVAYEEQVRDTYDKVDAAQDTITDGQGQPTVQSNDFDEVQLQLMESLLRKTQNRDTHEEEEDEDEDDFDLYLNLESGIKELKAKISTRKNTTKPPSDTSLKEWQMYRAIATKRAEDRADRESSKTSSDDSPPTSAAADGADVFDEDSIEINKQVTAWKEFQKREVEMRRATGLSIEVRMPFEWNRAPDTVDPNGGVDADAESRDAYDDEDEARRQKASSRRVISKQSRYDLDVLAIEVLQDLMDNTVDLDRRQNLKRDIDAMNVELEERLLAGLQDDVDVAGGTHDDDNNDESGTPSPAVELPTMGDILKSSRTEYQPSTPTDDPTDGSTGTADAVPNETTPAPRDRIDGATPAVSGDTHDTEDGGSVIDKSSDLERQDTVQDDIGDVGPRGESIAELPNLGTFEQQKFRSLVAGSGVRTEAEELQLRQNWEEFQKAEQKMRDSYGLSYTPDEAEDGSGEESVVADPTSGARDDGVVTTGSDTEAYAEFQKYEEQTKEAVRMSTLEDDRTEVPPNEGDEDKPAKKKEDDIIIHNKRATQWGSSSYSDQMYRSLAANGGNEVNDTLKENNKAAFQELLRRQDENRRSLQEMSSDTNVTDATTDAGTDTWEIDDINDYAEKALASLSARPKLRRQEKDPQIPPPSPRIDGQKSLSPSNTAASPRKNRGGGGSNVKSTGMKSRGRPSRATAVQEQMPDWLRKEIEEVRGDDFQDTEDYMDDDDDDYSDDDYSDDEFESDEKYIENERQAEEFGVQLLGATKAIDVGSVFGRDVFSSSSDGLDEYDSEEKRLSSTFSSFDARKANLLGYTVLSVAELNALMEHKRSSVENDVSPYASKMNRPFSEFAAIFRLEGALVDTSGLQFEAWKRTAEEHGLQKPTLDDIRYASVHHEEFAVRKIFYWADDIVTCRKIVLTYQKMMQDTINDWTKENSTNSVESQKEPTVIASNLHDDEMDRGKITNVLEQIDPTVLESDLIRIQVESWNMVANEYGFDAPAADMIQIAGALNPDESVRAVFGWTNDVSCGKEIAQSYRKYLRELTKNLAYKKDVTKPTTVSKIEQLPEMDGSGPNMDKVIELQHKAWGQTAKEFNYVPPTKEEVYATSFMETDKAIKSVFNWPLATDEIESVVLTFRKILKELFSPWAGKMQIQENQLHSDSSLKSEEYIPFFQQKEGATKWLRILQDVQMPCVVISYMSSETLDVILREMGLSEFFPDDKRVSSSSGYELDMQQMLGGALRAERRPDECVLFSSTPQSAASAHDVEMKNIALVSPYPYYELTSADMTVRELDSIRIINMKNIFSDGSTNEPMQELQLEGPEVKIRSLTKTKFWDEDGY